VNGSRLIAHVLAGLALVALAVVIVALGSGDGDLGDSEDAGGGSAAAVEEPDYETLLAIVESDFDLLASVTIAADGRTATVSETTGTSYTVEVPPGEENSLRSKLEAAGIEIEGAQPSSP
jgi:hypothetical protein